MGSLPAAPLSRGESLLRSKADQCLQWHQGPDWNVLGIHQLRLRQWQRFHNGSGLVRGLRVNQEDDAFAIATGIPLADFPVEVEIYGCPNLGRDNGHDLLKGHALPGSLNDQYFGGVRYSHA